MKPRTRIPAVSVIKRRTTLTIRADYLARARRIASARHVNLSAVISEALSEGLRQQSEAARSERILSQYKKAFGRFSDRELLILDGVRLEPANRP
jgi:post-segregation antitoxin (ccd killing protein)